MSSVSYYYHKRLLKHHGVNLTAKLTHKESHETVVEIDKVDRHVHIDELKGKHYQSASQLAHNQPKRI